MGDELRELMGEWLDAGRELVCDGEVMLPVTLGNVVTARSCEWYRVNKTFNRVFYGVLASRGVGIKASSDAIALLSKHSRALQLNARQVRGAWGLECGVFNGHGRFVEGVSEKWAAEVALLEDAGTNAYRKVVDGTFGDDDWEKVYADAIRCSESLSNEAPIDEEFAWIRANCGEWPNFASAPSRGAVKDWLQINKPGNEVLRNDFVKLGWQRRLATATLGKRMKQPALGIDAKPDEKQSAQQRAVYDELFGG